MFVGFVGDEIEGEDVVIFVVCELEEEIGWWFDCIEIVGEFVFLFGMVSEMFMLVIVYGLVWVSDGGGVLGEDIMVYCVVLDVVVDFIVVKWVEGIVIDVKLLLLLVFYLKLLV